MKITFLGTGTSTGVPVLGCDCEVCKSSDERDHRLRTSALVEIDDITILIDAGPDFRQQMLRSGKSRIDALLITHHHYDHVGGLDDLRGINYNTKKPVQIFADTSTIRSVHKSLYYVFEAHPYPGVPMMNITPIAPYVPFSVRGVSIMPVELIHRHLYILGYRIGNMVYLTDVSEVPKQTLPYIQEPQLLIIDALAQLPHPSHFSMQQAIDFARLIGAKQTYFTHISHKFGTYQSVSPNLPTGFFMAYDGLVVHI